MPEPTHIHIPEIIAELPRFLPWTARPRPNGRLAKVPVRLTEEQVPQPVNPLDPRHWQIHHDAQTHVHSGQADGLGIALTPDLGLTCIDIDDCRADNGALSPLALTILSRFPTGYVEISPSGRGLHLFAVGRVPAGWRRQAHVDIIDRGYVTVTGHIHRAASTWPDLTRDLAAWHREHSPVPGKPLRQPEPSPVLLPQRSINDIVQRAAQARNGARFQALWAGELAGYRSPSEADLALILMLLFWGGPGLTDAELLTLVRASGRHRAKWQTGSYAQRTLTAARRIRRQA